MQRRIENAQRAIRHPQGAVIRRIRVPTAMQKQQLAGNAESIFLTEDVSNAIDEDAATARKAAENNQ